MNSRSISIRAYHRVSWGSLLVVGISIAYFGGAISLSLAMPIGIISYFCVLQRLSYRTAGWTFWATFAISSAFYRASGDLIIYICEVLLGFLPFFVIRKEKTFGNWFALLSAALLSLVGVILGNTASLYMALILFLVLLVLALNSTNLLMSSPGELANRIRLPQNYFFNLFRASSTGLLSAAIIFLVFPRTHQLRNILGLRSRATATTAYSGALSLGPNRGITESSEIALIAESKELIWLRSVSSSLLFRGNALDHFDGVSWTYPNRELVPYSTASNTRYTQFVVPPSHSVKIYREPHDSISVLYPGVLFSMDVPTSLVGALSIDPSMSIVRSDLEIVRYAYDVIVADPIIPNQIENIRLSSLRNEIRILDKWKRREESLQLPDTIKNARFFSEWVNEVGSHSETTTLATVLQQIKSHFRNKFEASLEVEHPASDSFQNFISTSRKGHCEYFATATALYLRALGIPSRVVLGYRGGNFNEVSKVLEVREKDAHAWVEYFAPQLGWLSFDPTPIIPSPSLSRLSLYYTVYSNALKFWFNRYIANYNSDTQKQMIHQFRDTALRFHTARNGTRIPTERLAALLGVFCALLAIKILLRAWKKQRQSKLPRYYRQFILAAKLKGFERFPNETYRQFHERIRKSKNLVDLVEEIDARLEKELYGPYWPSL